MIRSHLDGDGQVFPERRASRNARAFRTRGGRDTALRVGAGLKRPILGQLAEPQLPELDRRPFGLQAEIALRGSQPVPPETSSPLTQRRTSPLMPGRSSGSTRRRPCSGASRGSSASRWATWAGTGVIFDVPTGKTSPWVVNQSAFLPVCFSYCSA